MLARRVDNLSASTITRGNFHALRHWLAMYLLMNGTPVKVESKHLWCARSSITLDIYSHATEGHKSEAIQAGLAGYGKRGRGPDKDNVLNLRRSSRSTVICAPAGCGI